MSRPASSETPTAAPLLERVPTATGGQVEIRWYGRHGVNPAVGIPIVSDEQRAELRDAIADVRTWCRRPARTDHDRARAEAERHGAAILAKPDHADAARVLWSVRIYYPSLGGELLCFEVPGLTERAADKLTAAHRQVDGEVAWGRSRKVSAPGSEAHDAEQWPAHKQAPPIRHGARLVVLPSQRAEPVEVVGGWDDDGDLGGGGLVASAAAHERAMERGQARDQSAVQRPHGHTAVATVHARANTSIDRASLLGADDSTLPELKRTTT